MGNDVTTPVPEDSVAQLVLWLDGETDALVRDIVRVLAARHPSLLAVILYGSVARHEERALSEPDPSDVDLLAVFDTDDEQVGITQGYAIAHSIGLAEERHLDAPREVQVPIASRTLGEWDPTFVEHVARDGIVLWARGLLPERFATLAGLAADREQAGRQGGTTNASKRQDEAVLPRGDRVGEDGADAG